MHVNKSERIDVVYMTTAQNNESLQWTWKDTLDRIQYIDTIISQIVSGAVLFDTALLAVFGALYFVFYTQNLSDDGKMIVKLSSIIVSFLGFFINLMLALNLSRQEYNRQWYFHIIPDNLPLEPHEKWLECDVTQSIKNYNMEPKLEL